MLPPAWTDWSAPHSIGQNRFRCRHNFTPINKENFYVENNRNHRGYAVGTDRHSQRSAGFGNSEKAGFDYYINQVGDTRIVHVCSGIAKVNAALCTQALIDTFQPAAVINAGIAGGMNNQIHVCDVVVSSEVLPMIWTCTS